MKDDEALHNARESERELAYLKAVSEWNDQHAAAWTAVLPELKLKLRKGQPITARDVPNSGRYGSHYAAFFDTIKSDSRAHKPAPDLHTLANVLDLIEDETVTTSSLRHLGITATTLRRLAEILQSAVPK